MFRAFIAALIGLTACGYPPLARPCGESGQFCENGQMCAPHQDVCVDLGGCGDGEINADKGEVSDDGNIVDGEMLSGALILDGCSHDCTSNQHAGTTSPVPKASAMAGGALW